MPFPQTEPHPAPADPALPKARVYAMLDTDGDGVASRHDYFVRIERARQATGRAEDDPLVAVARATGERAWAAMDANGDGVMTYQEYAAWVDAEKFDTVCQYALGALFDLADADRDGALDRSQFTALRQALGNPADHADAAFDALDGDGDGRVSRQDYLASIRAYVTGADSPMGEALY
ncbi:EF-hand domain-containing protein [Streptomyces rubellomurinus]|uniref:Calcium-binding protein n=2 Tax=Streptomyces TaxID=1883 RepID=A0A0F2TCV7_STRR3|nr:EF-hand domain-containing protein [Streptomyces rubellomurinus]KJS53357.1 calcium-binding protein [Streptomyces rubellomurinus subsp. indigoferus]KJS60979.1 calcium-binding protein [Streptomyces rubellomurinus]